MLAGGAIDAVGFWRFWVVLRPWCQYLQASILVVFGHVSGAVKVASGRVSDIWILYGSRVSERIGFYRFLGVTFSGCFGFFLVPFLVFLFCLSGALFSFLCALLRETRLPHPDYVSQSRMSTKGRYGTWRPRVPYPNIKTLDFFSVSKIGRALSTT